ncbi:Uncharacterised protein [Shigella sonnei]|nr:Uncharacterised protein [Shigella sonnei]CSS02790.1 Uncharacterised protein [Shigella sonnei]
MFGSISLIAGNNHPLPCLWGSGVIQVQEWKGRYGTGWQSIRHASKWYLANSFFAQNSPSCPVISVAKLSSIKGSIPSATGCSWRVR